jgi:hypothetical protein
MGIFRELKSILKPSVFPPTSVAFSTVCYTLVKRDIKLFGLKWEQAMSVQAAACRDWLRPLEPQAGGVKIQLATA